MFAQSTTHGTLLARVADGTDPAAWREFCDRYSDLIRGFATRQGLQPADCDDVVQESLVSLTKAMPGFQYDPSRGKFRSYIKTVVLHAIFKNSRQKEGQAALGDIEQLAHTASEDETVEQAWDSEWRAYHLRLAMSVIESEFNKSDRAAFQMYAVEDCDARETATKLGMSIEQVYQAKARVLRRLSEIIEQQVADEG